VRMLTAMLLGATMTMTEGDDAGRDSQRGRGVGCAVKSSVLRL